MEDSRSSTSLMAGAAQRAECYVCPGHSRPIDFLTHLGRLATFYPACRECVHRGEARLLSPAQARQWARLEQRAAATLSFTAEEFAASTPNDLTPAVMARLARAVATLLWHERDESRPAPLAPSVVVATDGHWSTAELVSAACQELARCGCRTTDVGAAPAAALVRFAQRQAADLAAWIGNVSGTPHALSVKFWGPDGRPWSSPGALDRVGQAFDAAAARPRRRGGVLSRGDAIEEYLAPLRPLYHGLRPLRFVLDTACEPLQRCLSALTAVAACEIVRPATFVTPSENAADMPFLQRRLARIGQAVVTDAAHFGLWTSGDGERLHLVDERGTPVDAARLLALFAGVLRDGRADAGTVLEEPFALSSQRPRELAQHGTSCGATSREAMQRAMISRDAVLGGGPSGRIWFADPTPVADALAALSLLLTILSGSDRPLSEVLDAA